MDEPVFLQPGEGERIRSHRVLAELPHVEAIELFFPSDFEGVERGFRPAGTDIRLLNLHTPRVGFVDSLRH